MGAIFSVLGRHKRSKLNEIKEHKGYWRNGKIYSQEFYRNGQPEGEHKYWDEDENIQNLISYKNGSLDGESKSWYRNGQLCTQEFYRNGKAEGETKSWHANGTLGMRTLYQNGVAKEMMKWFDNGNLEGSLTWQSGTSQYKFWDIEGNLWKHDIYRDRLCETKEWYHNGQLRIHGFSRSGIWEEKLETWHDNGYPKTWEFFRGEECREGECKCWMLTGSCLRTYCRNGLIIDENFTIRKKMALLSIKRKLSPLKYIHALLATFILDDLTNPI